MGADTLINLHTHTRFSDGDFLPEQIVLKASETGVSYVAITDHFMTAKVRSLRKEELDRYISTIKRLGEKYDGNVNVLVGVEIDACPARSDLWDLPFKKLNDLDLVHLEYLGDIRSGGISLERAESLLSRIDVPCGLAHPDLSRIFDNLPPEEVAKMICDAGLFVEVNTAHPYRRDGLYFFEHAKEIYREFRGRVRVSVGTDVHRTLSQVSDLDGAYRFVKELKLEGDLLVP